MNWADPSGFGAINTLQATLSIIGFYPGPVGAIANLINGFISMYRGDDAGMIQSFVGAATFGIGSIASYSASKAVGSIATVGYMSKSAASPITLNAAKVEGAVANDLVGSSLRVNPTRNMQNCVNCVIATDQKLAGNLVSAMPGRPTSPVVLERLYQGSFQSVSCPMEIGSILSQTGNGARGIVLGASKTTNAPGHVWNVVNQNGTIRFLDGQTGATGAKALRNFEDFKNFRFLPTN